MFKEMIENIQKEYEADIDCVMIKHQFETDQIRHAYNMGLDEAIKIINSYKPKWVDKPEPNGWYWIKDFCNIEIQCVYVYTTKFRGSLGGRFDITEYKGKWLKQYLPEMGKIK